MHAIKFKRFTRTRFLTRIGRELLDEFFAGFAAELKDKGLALPATSPDEMYFQSLAAILMSPELLPERLTEALFAIDELAGPEGQERLEVAVAAAGLDLPIRPESSGADLALQVWLAAPELVARKHNEQRLLHLTAFEYFGAAPSERLAPPFNAPGAEAIEQLTAMLDAAFARHHRGIQTARIEVYPLQGDLWFLVRHGDLFTRTSRVESRRTDVLHFRPEKDDVVVYCPRHDEIRINARYQWERKLYRQEFGRCLRGGGDYFAERKTYTLEPLRDNGADALDTSGLAGIRKISLRELEVAWDHSGREVVFRDADDLFRSQGGAENEAGPVPPAGRLARAAFELQFEDSPHPRPVQIRPPNILKLGRHCDIQLVDEWLCQRGFRVRA